MLDWPRTPAANTWAREFLLSKGVWTTDGAHYLFWLSAVAPQWVVAFDSWLGKTCQLHFAAARTRCPPRGMIRAVFHYAFLIQERELVFGLVDSTNRAALRFDLWLGFEESIRYAGVASTGGDIIVLKMPRSKCRWLKELHEQEHTPRS